MAGTDGRRRVGPESSAEERGKDRRREERGGVGRRETVVRDSRETERKRKGKGSERSERELR